MAAFQDIAITNNQSETFNEIIKDAISHKELSLDALVLSLFQLQASCLNEYNRALKDIGQFHASDKHPKLHAVELGRLCFMSIRDRVTHLRKSVAQSPQPIERYDNYRATAKSIAELILQHNLICVDGKLKACIMAQRWISVDGKLKACIMQSPFTSERYLVLNDVNKNICSCASTVPVYVCELRENHCIIG